MAEVSLVQPIVDGELVEKTTKKKDTTGTSELGKDQFLQLLVTQMQNQNPLQPSSDTEWISQLANFSSLEAMQNMSGTMTGTQAMSMVGKYVDIVAKTDSGKTNNESGYVDFVNVKDGNVQVSVNGKLYDAAEVVNVYDDYYLLQNGIGTEDNANKEETGREETDKKTENV
ncbi:MAG: hypothetical protein E7262_00990 [Lachnospiraceae bacterium]|nr:hypothetical protein [Lachnospiraceae bacterium]